MVWALSRESSTTSTRSRSGCYRKRSRPAASLGKRVLHDAVVKCLHNPVAFTTGGFQPFPVYDSHDAMSVCDETCLLQRAGHDRNRLAAHAQLSRQQLVREPEFVLPRTVLRHQQPPAQ